MLICGRCHCGNIAFQLRWEPEPAHIPARACTCAFCRKHGGVWTSCPTGTLRVRVQDDDAVHRYAFGTRTAVFHVCSRCGVVPVVTCELDGRTYGVVSVNAFEDVDPALLQRDEVSFDGEGVDDRLARRRRNWIPDVAFSPARS
ncbi:hypothetical protein GCM10028796_34640 [Ramlibacter monticola]|uniref:CENP-V/GFA domain-containing protein n=1 Tax=Ramlibacter monticola TaxID=1926872 RepID=A0A937CZM0_9BURK|nr:hypothetical protein [Ramlibacter monticola]MBL0395207.1 hypothetical protein [Ramlibacter monticola]